MEPLLVVSLLLSFFTTLFFMPFWIKKVKQIGLVWEDMHKIGHERNVAGSGGMGVFFGFVLGILVYVAVKTFYIKSNQNILEIFSILSTISLIVLIGFIDDLFGWRHGGLSIRSRILMLVFASIPLIIINAEKTNLFGFEFGLIYPLVIIPIGIIGAATTFNILAGYNGLETGQGILILSALAIVTYRTGNSWLSFIGLIMIAALIAFYFFNKIPAKVFPGDVLTYSLGTLIAIMAIFGHIEKIAIFFFIPYILEAILKTRGKLKMASFAKLNSDGSLDEPYGKIYGLEHLAVRLLKKMKTSKQAYEKEVVMLINLFQLIIIFLGFFLFKIKLI